MAADKRGRTINRRSSAFVRVLILGGVNALKRGAQRQRGSPPGVGKGAGGSVKQASYGGDGVAQVCFHLGSFAVLAKRRPVPAQLKYNIPA